MRKWIRFAVFFQIPSAAPPQNALGFEFHTNYWWFDKPLPASLYSTIRNPRVGLTMAQNLTAVDCFSGAGGTSLGLVLAGFRILAAVDVDKDANETYKKNTGVEPIEKNIEDVTPREILKLAHARRGEVHLVVGCPPCQGFTRLNKKRRRDRRNVLVETFGKLATGMNPPCIVFENVPGAVRSKYFREFCRILRENKYRYTCKILNAADYGIPQRRRRVILVATKRDFGPSPGLPERTHSSPKKAGKNGLLQWKTVRETISDLPPIRAGELHPRVPNHRAMKITPHILRIIKKVPKNGGSRINLPKNAWLRCHRKVEGFNDVYGRLRWDAPSNTITSGCTNLSRGRFIHPKQNRAISAREAARLQTFPDSYEFLGTFTSISKQIGEAFPPKFFEAIAIHLKKNFFEHLA